MGIFDEILGRSITLPEQIKKTEYLQLVRDHDFWHEFSEDHRVWLAGRRSLDRIRELQPEVDPDFSIWRQYAPIGFKVP